MLQRQLGEAVPVDCNNRRQRHVPTRCLLHRFFHVPTTSSGEEDHAHWCIILGIFWNPTYRSQHEHPAKFLNVYMHPQLISTIHMYDILSAGCMPTCRICCEWLWPMWTPRISACRWVPEVTIPAFAFERRACLRSHCLYAIPIRCDLHVMHHGLRCTAFR